MKALGRRAWAPLHCALYLALWGGCECDSRRPSEIRGAAPESLSLARPPPGRARFIEDAGAPSSSQVGPRATADERSPDERGTSPELGDATAVEGGLSGPFIVDGLVDVAAAGPATSTEQGVVMVNRNNQLRLARLRGALDSGSKPRPTALAGLPEDAGPFPLARGPAVKGGVAYWVSRGQLLAQRVAGGSARPAVLAQDARVGTRVAVPVGPPKFAPGLPELAAYIARPKGPDAPLTARLWVRGQAEPLSLTDDATSAHSVALIETSDGVAALLLEARTGMSAIHLREIRFSKSRTPAVGEDRIVWIGGPGRSSTELFAEVAGDSTLRGLLTLERDATHFGLVELGIPLVGSALPVEPEWLLYENGIEPAPFATAMLCGRARVILARPTSASPGAPQELVLLGLDAARRSPALILARSRAFFEVSLARLGEGALLSYVADRRTWGRVIRCVGG